MWTGIYLLTHDVSQKWIILYQLNKPFGFSNVENIWNKITMNLQPTRFQFILVANSFKNFDFTLFIQMLSEEVAPSHCKSEILRSLFKAKEKRLSTGKIMQFQLSTTIIFFFAEKYVFEHILCVLIFHVEFNHLYQSFELQNHYTFMMIKLTHSVLLNVIAFNEFLIYRE